MLSLDLWRHCNKASQRGRLVAVTPALRGVTCILMPARSPQQHNARPQLHNIILARPHLC